MIGLLGGGLLVALPAAGATESPPDCEDVRVLAESFQPSAAVALAEQIDAVSRSASPSSADSAATMDPAASAGTPNVTASIPAAVCAAELGDAKERADAAGVALDFAQRQDAEATEIEPRDAAAAADLREQARALYALALTTDAGLTEARAGIVPERAEAADKARLSAAQQLKALQRPAAARLLASDLVLTGAVKAEDVEAAGLGPVPSPPVRVTEWWKSTASPWLEVGAWVAAFLAAAWIVFRALTRSRDYELQTPVVSSEGADLDGAVADWSVTVPRALDSLSTESPMVRYLATPDAEFTLPSIGAVPVGFKAVVEFWTWFRRLRRRVVTTTLEVVDGTPTAHVAIRTRSGKAVARTTLRTIRSSIVPTLDATRISQAFVDLASEAAAWIAFEFTAKVAQVSIFGSTRPGAVVHVAGAAAAKRREDRPGIRAELNAARTEDPEMLEARLNLAVLDITKAGPELFTLDADSVESGSLALVATSSAARGLLDLADPGVEGPGPSPGKVARRDWARVMAIDLRARYNHVIAVLNMGEHPAEGPRRAQCALELQEVMACASRLVAAMEGTVEFDEIVRTARDIRRQAWLLRVGHTLAWPGGLQPRLTEILAQWQVVGREDFPWSGDVLDVLDAAIPLPEIEPDLLPAATDYSIACIAAERGTPQDVENWLNRAIAKDAPRYLRAARKDPYFAGMGLDLPDPDAVPDAEEDAPTGGPVAMAVVVVNAADQSA
ncbi:hypothetical protein [Oerskovia sp. KBS0722]|uniref:hypothetical protein n=1 Tax=Oerskovia sp. KBS0722 TaxID=1179673 RepID=UPI00110D6AA2|nr:hypothetical protein [Oerskovia sp. KBS0722]QDW61640.1 hypothetical protein FFI11_003105 [Oerskovia sp. KBS0722]